MVTCPRTLASAALAGAVAAVALASAPAATAATKTTGHPVCFTGGDGVCTPIGNGKSVHLVGTATGFAGIFFNGKSTQGKAPADVDYSFDYTGQQNGGAPRFSIPIDENGDGVVGEDEGYAFLDANGCGLVGSGTVSTESATCTVFHEAAVYPNWDAFAATAATNGWTVAKKDVPFVISDVPSDVVVSNIAFVVD
jgi:hypothetical protein